MDPGQKQDTRSMNRMGQNKIAASGAPCASVSAEPAGPDRPAVTYEGEHRVSDHDDRIKVTFRTTDPLTQAGTAAALRGRPKSGSSSGYRRTRTRS